MKHSFTIIFLLSLSISSYAQFEKGGKQVGGVLSAFQNQSKNGFTTSDGFIRSTESTVTEIQILPRLGFFVNDNISVGFGLGYSRISSSSTQVAVNEQTFDTKSVTSTLQVVFFSRFHKSISDDFSFFIQPTATGSFGSSLVGTDDPLEADVLGYGIGVSPGFVFMVSEKFGLEATFGRLGYSRQTQTFEESDTDDAIKNINTNYGIDISLRTFELGLQYYF
ncbi:MAG: hypothetical protein RIF33_16390 [Cyclobacteriaceae bacterium]